MFGVYWINHKSHFLKVTRSSRKWFGKDRLCVKKSNTYAQEKQYNCAYFFYWIKEDKTPILLWFCYKESTQLIWGKKSHQPFKKCRFWSTKTYNRHSKAVFCSQHITWLNFSQWLTHHMTQRKGVGLYNAAKSLQSVYKYNDFGPLSHVGDAPTLPTKSPLCKKVDIFCRKRELQIEPRSLDDC